MFEAIEAHVEGMLRKCSDYQGKKKQAPSKCGRVLRPPCVKDLGKKDAGSIGAIQQKGVVDEMV